ncbi:MAG: T9SS type A sorting domain-containing protein [Bacteroidales bacterium]|nr:T9SS type A sorting domain-containing protein [Bacteroidales bacterium]
MQKYMLLFILLVLSFTRCYAQVYTGNMVWKWDTVICYDEQNAVMERLSQTFDNSGYAISQLIEEKSGNTWVNVSRVIYTNDLSGRVATALTDLWQAGAWAASVRVSVTYSVSGQITMESVERNQGGLWGAYVKRIYSYDSNGRKTSMIQQRWIGGDWENDLKTSYTYPANTITVLTEYSDDGNPWQVGGRLTYTCDLNGNYIELLMESFEENQWLSSFKIDYTNDAEGNILSEWAYAPFGNGWVSDSRKTYTYDNNGNVVTGKNEEWDAGTWLPDLQTSYLYNNKEYMLLLNVPVYRYEVTYRGFPLGMEEKQGMAFHIYPNPAADFVTVDLRNNCSDVPVISLQDHLGRPVKAPELDHDRMQFDVRSLPAGLYLISVKTKEGTASRKLIIQ